MLYGHTTHDTGYTEVVDIYSFADFDSVAGLIARFIR